MNLNTLHNIYFVGIGGIGMSALARHFHAVGCKVSGYDKTRTALTQELEAGGIAITYEDSISTLDVVAEMVVYTPAIPKDHQQLNYYLNNGYSVKKRAEVLGILANSAFGLAVAGSHGKTSTSSILNHIMQTAKKDCAAFLGGVSINYNSNYVDGDEYCIAEADEFDRSFHQLFPKAAIITSVDTDHLDVYGNYESIKAAFKKFASQVEQTLIYNSAIPKEVVNKSIDNFSYGWDEQADFYPTKVSVDNGWYHFAIQTPTTLIDGFKLQGGGRHNIENAVGAFALAQQIGVEVEAIQQAIATYKGVKRRFHIHVEEDDFVYIDDYAHHPKEIEVTLSTVRELYPNKKVTAVFQPHLFSRTNDLKEGLAKSLSIADEVLLLDIYPAREKPIEGVTSGVIYSLLTNSAHRMPKNQVIQWLLANNTELLLTIGAGDIDTLVQPIIEKYKKVEKNN